MKKILYLSLVAVLGIANIDMAEGGAATKSISTETNIAKSATASSEGRKNMLTKTLAEIEEGSKNQVMILDNSQLTLEEIDVVCSSISTAKLAKLVITAPLPDSGADKIASALHENPTVKQVILWGLRSGESAKIINALQQGNAPVEYLSLKGDFVTEDIDAITNFLRGNSSIETLYIFPASTGILYNAIKESSLLDFADALQEAPSLKELALTGVIIPDAVAEKLAEIIQKPTLKSLRLRYSGETADALRARAMIAEIKSRKVLKDAAAIRTDGFSLKFEY